MVSTPILVLLCMAAFSAGFVDAIAGGGGLIQTPAALILLPQYPVSAVIGSLKIPAFSGTGMAAFQYSRRVTFNPGLFLAMGLFAFTAAFLGSELLTRVSNQFMKPVLLIILLAVAIYTFIKKDFGRQQEVHCTPRQAFLRGILFSTVVGFYDGFIGPGTGSFLVLGFIALLGFDFLHASAYAKMVNLSTNLGSIILFTIKGSIIWGIALPMAASNAAGGWLGSKLALARGNRFIRIFFLTIVLGTLIRFGWDVFK